MSAREKSGRQYVNYYLFKKNKRGEFQRRMLQVDASNGVVRNIKNFREKERQRFKFSDIKGATPDPQNPLELTIEFTNGHANELSNLLNDIIKNTSLKKEIKLNPTEVILKEGPAEYKKKTFGWDRRYLYLTPLYLHCFSQDNKDISRHVINLFATPISKEEDKLICIHATLQLYLWEFDTVDQRNDWFEALIKGSSHEERGSIVRKGAVALEKESVVKSLTSLKASSKSTQADILRVTEETKTLETKHADLEIKLRDLKQKADALSIALGEATATKKAIEEQYKVVHEALVSAQAEHDLVSKALEAHVQQLQQSQDMLKQFDAQITQMTESPAVITAQVEQLKEKISLAQEKAKEVEGKIKEIEETEEAIEVEIEQQQKQKESVLQELQVVLQAMQATKAELDTLQNAINAFRTELAKETARLEILQREELQTKEKTAATEAETDVLLKEIAVFS